MMVATLQSAQNGFLRCNLFDFRDFCRVLKFAAASLAILATACFSATGQTPACKASNVVLGKKLAARDVLNKGVQAFKNENYDEAVCYFLQATELDSHLPVAKQYLGTALAQEVIPGLDTPDNLKVAQRAIDVFQEVLAQDPHDVNSLKQVAAVCFNVKRLDDARDWQKKVLVEDPKDADAAYTIGVIDWMEAHRNALEVLQPAGFNDDGEGNAEVPATVMELLKAKNGVLIEEGLLYLNQAVENRPNYDDAMAYLNLIYRRKADLDFGNEAARLDDVAKAQEWARKSMETRKANEEKKIAGTDSAKP